MAVTKMPIVSEIMMCDVGRGVSSRPSNACEGEVKGAK